MLKSRDASYRYVGLAALATVLSGAYVSGLILDKPYWLRGVNWLWVRRLPELNAFRLALLLLLLAGWLFMTVWVFRSKDPWKRWQTALLIAAAVLLTPLSQLIVSAQHRSQPLSVAFLTTLSVTSGFFDEGVRLTDPGGFIRNHADRMPHYAGDHLRVQPPGWPLTFWAVRQIWSALPEMRDWITYRLFRYDCLSPVLRTYAPEQVASATLQMGVPLWTGLGAIPLYLLGKRVFSVRIARLSIVIYPLLPALLVFQARFDAFYSVVTTTAMWLAHRIIKGGRWFDYLLLAALMTIASAYSFNTLAYFILVNVIGIAFACLGTKTWTVLRRLALLDALTGVLMLVTWGAVWIRWEASWLEWFNISQQIHRQVRASNPLWPLFNLYDFGVFLGLPLFVWALAGAGAAVWRFIQHQSRRGDAFMIGWLAFLLLIDLSGVVRAETGRIWTFLMIPGLLVGIAALLPQSNDEPGRQMRPPGSLAPWSGLVLLSFAIQALVVGYFLGGRIPTTRTPQPRWNLPVSAERIDYRLGDTITLQGYEITTTQDAVTVILYWRALERTYGDYSTFTHLMQDGMLISQSDGVPSEGGLPTWCWVPGEVVKDVRTLPAASLQEGPYQVRVGLYSYQDGLRLPVSPPAPNDIIRFALMNDPG